MKILIAVASRHGSTREIADAIALDLRWADHEVDVREPGQLDSLAPYDAAIVGSAVYLGSWLPEARDFVRRLEGRLAQIPVWLFSSGPVGPTEPRSAPPPAHLDDLIQAVHARGHRTFVGKIDRSKLSLGERLIATVVRAPDGDFRTWNDVHAWTGEIIGALAVASAKQAS